MLLDFLISSRAVEDSYEEELEDVFRSATNRDLHFWPGLPIVVNLDRSTIDQRLTPSDSRC